MEMLATAGVMMIVTLLVTAAMMSVTNAAFCQRAHLPTAVKDVVVNKLQAAATVMIIV